MNITKAEQKKLHDALWAIDVARNTVQEINDAMTKEKRWNGQTDINQMLADLTLFSKQYAWAKNA